MFTRARQHRLSGFTLVELAIVLGIVGVLASGLWRLMATSTQQTKDVATAQQHQSLIHAVQAYLADASATGGQAWLGNTAVFPAPGTVANLPLPLTCPAGNPTFCSYLPNGFTSATRNPYGQSYTIQVMAGATNAQQNYSFMITASGAPKAIPDPDGGRISALIGGDGGFIYTSPVCTLAQSSVAACGTMGGWKVPDVTAAPALGGYLFPAAATGYGSVASLTFVSSALSNDLNWLARVLMPGDPNFSFNTMQTPFYLGGGAAAGNTFFFGSYNNAGTYQAATASTIMKVEGGIIDVGSAGSVTLEADPNGAAYQIVGNEGGQTGAGFGLGGGRIFLQGNMTMIAPPAQSNPLLKVKDPCIANNAGPPPTFSNCGLAVAISGNVGITGMLNSNVFIYTGSDERLKKDINPLPSSLDNIMKLRPVSFVYKAGNSFGLGFVAQDIEKVYPQMVITGQSGMKEVAYDELIAPIVKSIQELKTENDALKVTLQDQTKRQEKLEEEIRKMRPKQ